MSVAVMFHVGNSIPVAEMLRDINNLRLAQVKHDLFVNLVEGKVDVKAMTSLIKLNYPSAVIVVSENRGMDIGGFFKLLPLVLKGSYTYILKLHTKSMISWRRSLIVPLCGSVYHVQHNLRTLAGFPTVGMLGATGHLYRELPLRKPNFYYLQRLAKEFKIPYPRPFHFIGGTMFYVRVSVIEKAFSGLDLEVLWAGMNTPQTLDKYWYLINYRDKGVTTVEQAEAHFLTHGKKAGRFHNCLDAREKGSMRYIPDGMIEHAYERLFGLIVENGGMTIQGVY